MEELKQRILNLCNESELPIEAVMFVLKDAWRDAEAALRMAKAQFPQNVPQAKDEVNEKEE